METKNPDPQKTSFGIVQEWECGWRFSK